MNIKAFWGNEALTGNFKLSRQSFHFSVLEQQGGLLDITWPECRVALRLSQFPGYYSSAPLHESSRLKTPSIPKETSSLGKYEVVAITHRFVCLFLC